MVLFVPAQRNLQPQHMCLFDVTFLVLFDEIELFRCPTLLRPLSFQLATYPCILYPDHKNWFTNATFLGIEVRTK